MYCISNYIDYIDHIVLDHFAPVMKMFGCHINWSLPICSGVYSKMGSTRSQKAWRGRQISPHAAIFGVPCPPPQKRYLPKIPHQKSRSLDRCLGWPFDSDSLQEVDREKVKELPGRYCKPCHLHSYEIFFVGKVWVDSRWLAACDVTSWQPKGALQTLLMIHFNYDSLQTLLMIHHPTPKYTHRKPSQFIHEPEYTKGWLIVICHRMFPLLGSPGLPQLPRKETEKVKEKRVSPSKVRSLGGVKWRRVVNIFRGIQILQKFHPLSSDCEQSPQSSDPLMQNSWIVGFPFPEAESMSPGMGLKVWGK